MVAKRPDQAASGVAAVHPGQVGERGQEVGDGGGAGMKRQPRPVVLGLQGECGAGENRRLARPWLPGDHQRPPGRPGSQPATDRGEGRLAAAEQVSAAGDAALPAGAASEVIAGLGLPGPGHQPAPRQRGPHSRD